MFNVADLSPFVVGDDEQDDGSDSRSNPFQGREDDVITPMINQEARPTEAPNDTSNEQPLGSITRARARRLQADLLQGLLTISINYEDQGQAFTSLQQIEDRNPQPKKPGNASVPAIDYGGKSDSNSNFSCI